MRTYAGRIAITLTVLALVTTVAMAGDAASRRMALLDNPTVEKLAEGIEDRDPLVARTAARLLPSAGTEALIPLGKALRHDDALVRRNAAMNLDALGSEGLELVERALRDDNELVRQGAVYALIDMPPSDEVRALLDRAGSDESSPVQRAAVMALRASYETAGRIALPAEGWRFQVAEDEVGLNEEWFAADLDDSGWEPIAIEQFWGDQGPAPGVGWYRRTITLPDREPPARAQLDFQAVDESTWVWVNGEFAGEHDRGPSGWATPFRIDVTDMLNWGGENQISVRVLNTAMAGGIYKPVSLVLLEPAE